MQDLTGGLTCWGPMAQSPLVTPDNTTRKKLTMPEFPLEALAMWGRSFKVPVSKCQITLVRRATKLCSRLSQLGVKKSWDHFYVQQGVCHTGEYLKAKEELWKLKYFTMQKYNLKKIL
jgi:hypothetical protein